MSGLPWGAGQVVVAEGILVVRAGGPSDLLEDLGREDLRTEDRLDVLRLHLVDECGNVGGVGVGEVLRLDCSDDLPPEVLREIGK